MVHHGSSVLPEADSPCSGECELLGRLHHPCVVQFLGMCFEQGSPLPVLVMEYLHTTLSTCLERYGVLPKEMSYA